jgi:hypothetical protein
MASAPSAWVARIGARTAHVGQRRTVVDEILAGRIRGVEGDGVIGESTPFPEAEPQPTERVSALNALREHDGWIQDSGDRMVTGGVAGPEAVCAVPSGAKAQGTIFVDLYQSWRIDGNRGVDDHFPSPPVLRKRDEERMLPMVDGDPNGLGVVIDHPIDLIHRGGCGVEEGKCKPACAPTSSSSRQAR